MRIGQGNDRFQPGMAHAHLFFGVFGEVNIVASAEGKIIPGSRIKKIQPLNNSIVKKILVREGDFVVKGQALVELDETLTLADQQRLQQELANTRVDLAVNTALSKLVSLPDERQAEVSYEMLHSELKDLRDERIIRRFRKGYGYALRPQVSIRRGT